MPFFVHGQVFVLLTITDEMFESKPPNVPLSYLVVHVSMIFPEFCLKGANTSELSPLDFQVAGRRYYQFRQERHYWLQYTEWWVRPHLLHFSALSLTMDVGTSMLHFFEKKTDWFWRKSLRFQPLNQRCHHSDHSKIGWEQLTNWHQMMGMIYCDETWNSSLQPIIPNIESESSTTIIEAHGHKIPNIPVGESYHNSSHSIHTYSDSSEDSHAGGYPYICWILSASNWDDSINH